MVHKPIILFSERLRFSLFMVLETIGFPKGLRKKAEALKGKLYKDLHSKSSTRMTYLTKAVPREIGLDKKSFHTNFFNKSKPVIFNQAAMDWPCCREWDFDFFQENFGEQQLLLVDAEGLTTQKKEKGFEVLNLKELISDIKGGGGKYLRFSPLVKNNKKLSDALNLNWLSRLKPMFSIGNTFYMFLGAKGGKTYLHSDQPCNLFVQVTGEKKWKMILPKDAPFLYPETSGTAYIKSPVDLDNVDYEKFPLMKNVTVYEAHLKAGDILYIPPHVWHHVENLSAGISVGYRFSSINAALRSSLLFSVIRVLSNNPPFWKTIKYGKRDTNLIWAHSNGIVEEVLCLLKKRSKGNE